MQDDDFKNVIDEVLVRLTIKLISNEYPEEFEEITGYSFEEIDDIHNQKILEAIKNLSEDRKKKFEKLRTKFCLTIV